MSNTSDQAEREALEEEFKHHTGDTAADIAVVAAAATVDDEEQEEDTKAQMELEQSTATGFDAVFASLTEENLQLLGRLETLLKGDLERLFPATSFPDAKHRQTLVRDMLVRNMVAKRFVEADTVAKLQKSFAYESKTFPIEMTSQVRTELQAGRYYMRGHDLAGRPILNIVGRNFHPDDSDIDSAVAAVTWFVRNAERTQLYQENDVYQITAVYDREGFTLANFDKPLLKAVAKLLSDHAPERLHRLLIYPTGWLFRRLWGVVKYFFDPRTRQKIIPLSSKEKFLEYIAKEQLGTAFGGEDTYEFSIPDMNASVDTYLQTLEQGVEELEIDDMD